MYLVIIAHFGRLVLLSIEDAVVDAADFQSNLLPNNLVYLILPFYFEIVIE